MTADSLRQVCRAQIKRGNRAWVEQLEEKALAKIMKGGGEIAPFESGSLNGKTFSREVRMDAAQVAAIARELIDEADADDAGPSTGFDFSRVCPL